MMSKVCAGVGVHATQQGNRKTGVTKMEDQDRHVEGPVKAAVSDMKAAVSDMQGISAKTKQSVREGVLPVRAGHRAGPHKCVNRPCQACGRSRPPPPSSLSCFICNLTVWGEWPTD